MVQERIYSYFERNPQLHVLFIFDRMNIIQTELEGVTWDEGLYVYKVFDGAWFNTKYAIENTWKDKRIVLLFTDGTYPHTEEQMLKFPLLSYSKVMTPPTSSVNRTQIMCSSSFIESGSLLNFSLK